MQLIILLNQHIHIVAVATCISTDSTGNNSDKPGEWNWLVQICHGTLPGLIVADEEVFFILLMIWQCDCCLLM